MLMKICETYIFRAMTAICDFIYGQWFSRVLAAGRQQKHKSGGHPDIQQSINWGSKMQIFVNKLKVMSFHVQILSLLVLMKV